jgi:hypothetical protein
VARGTIQRWLRNFCVALCLAVGALGAKHELIDKHGEDVFGVVLFFVFLLPALASILIGYDEEGER